MDLLLAAFVVHLSLQAPAAGGNPAAEVIQIDGALRPDLVPEWSAWGYVFRIVAGGPRELPSDVHVVASPEEKALVLREADALQKAEAACQARLAKIFSARGSDSLEAVDARMHEVTLECRRETLRARDRVLAGLNPRAAAALTAFADSTRAGTSITLPKKKLARFLEPE